MHYRAVFISDTHLASKKAKAKPLADFLKHNTFYTIYLVGDVIDIWRFKQVFSMSQHKQNEHLEVVERLLKHARKGAVVHYIWGNHDEFMAKFRGHEIFGSVSLHERMDYITTSGTRYLVLHGHQFDLLTKYPMTSWLYITGDWAYEGLLQLNDLFNWCRRLVGMRYWSVSKYVKVKVKRATQFIESFEAVTTRYARDRGYGGVICGHLHDPKIKTVDGTVYANCGCWTEKDNCTFLYEDGNGDLKIGNYSQI